MVFNVTFNSIPGILSKRKIRRVLFVTCMVEILLVSCTTNDERNHYLGMLIPRRVAG
jgi:hypothetical protein